MTAEENATTSPKVKPTHHFGRGGAGNKTTKDAKSPMLPPEPTPTLKGEMYTTGRGGTGNMAKNDPTRPEEARAAQDVDDIPEMALPEGPRFVGRGGAANMHKPVDGDKVAGQQDSDRVRRESSNKDRSGLKGLAKSGKDFLMGKKKDEEPKSEERV